MKVPDLALLEIKLRFTHHSGHHTWGGAFGICKYQLSIQGPSHLQYQSVSPGGVVVSDLQASFFYEVHPLGKAYALLHEILSLLARGTGNRQMRALQLSQPLVLFKQILPYQRNLIVLLIFMLLLQFLMT